MIWLTDAATHNHGIANVRPSKLARALQEPIANALRFWYSDPEDNACQATTI